MNDAKLIERKRTVASELSSFEMAMDQVYECKQHLRDAVAHANRMRERLMNVILSDSAEVRSDD